MSEIAHNFQLGFQHGYELMPEQAVHELKVWPVFFDALDAGDKTFEVRKNDRGFKVGDILFLYEWDEVAQDRTHRYLYREVTYVLPGGQFGVEPDYVVMALAEVD